jgi:hypothetical protein
VVLRLEVLGEGVAEDTSEDELDKHMEACYEQRVWECKAVGGEHPFIVDREQRGKEKPG